jgi:HSP20 family protein
MFALKPWTKRRASLLPRVEAPAFSWVPEELSNLVNRFFTRWPMELLEEEEYPWGLTMEEKEKEVLVRVELPGFESAEVEVLGERLTVEAEHKEPAEKAEKKGEVEMERAYTHVKRVVTLPEGTEVEKAEAVYRNGVLEVRVPRRPRGAESSSRHESGSAKQQPCGRSDV